MYEECEDETSGDTQNKKMKTENIDEDMKAFFACFLDHMWNSTDVPNFFTETDVPDELMKTHKTLKGLAQAFTRGFNKVVETHKDSYDAAAKLCGTPEHFLFRGVTDDDFPED